MSKDAEEMIRTFADRYSGMFGNFTVDEDADPTHASASSPDGDNNSIVMFDICDDPAEKFSNRRSFIESKRKRLGPMGKLEQFEHRSDSIDSYGGILNFSLLGKKGGFFFYTAYKDDVLVFIQAYSTSGKGQIPDSERDALIDAALELI